MRRQYNNPFPVSKRNTNEDHTSITFQTVFGTALTPQPPGAADINYNPDFSANSFPPFNSLPGANGPVLAIDVINSTSVIGGEFTGYNSAPAGRIARVDSQGYTDTNFNAGLGFNSFVSALATVPANGSNANKFYAGGNFTSFDSTTRNYIARLFPNGRLDTVFNPATALNGTVRAMAIAFPTNLPAGTEVVYVGGDFTPRAGLQPNRMARLRADGSLDLTFDTGTGFNAPVRALAVYANGTNAGKILVAGDFTLVNGQIFNRIVRLDFNGQVDPTFFSGDGFDGPVYGLAIQTDGAIIAVGGFRTFDLRIRGHVARLNSDGSLDETYETGSGFDNSAYAVALEPGTGKAFIGGSFVDYNGTRRRGVARLLTDGSSIPASWIRRSTISLVCPGSIPGSNRRNSPSSLVPWRSRWAAISWWAAPSTWWAAGRSAWTRTPATRSPAGYAPAEQFCPADRRGAGPDPGERLVHGPALQRGRIRDQPLRDPDPDQWHAGRGHGQFHDPRPHCRTGVGHCRG